MYLVFVTILYVKCPRLNTIDICMYLNTYTYAYIYIYIYIYIYGYEH